MQLQLGSQKSTPSGAPEFLQDKSSLNLTINIDPSPGTV